MTDIDISISFSAAYGYFLRSLRYQNLHFSIEDLPLPKFLVRNRHYVPTRTSEFFVSLYSFLLFIIAFFSFTYYWLRLRRDIKFIYKWLLNNKKEIKFLAEQIPKYTNFKWSRDSVFIHPVIAFWGGERLGRIYIGIRPIEFIDNPTLDLVIHELIHANVPESINNDLKGSVSNFSESEELSVVVLTRRIQRNELNLEKDKLQKLPLPLKELISTDELLDFEKSVDHVESFSSLMVYADQFLKDKIN